MPIWYEDTTKRISCQAIDVLRRMLYKDPRSRYTAHDAA